MGSKKRSRTALRFAITAMLSTGITALHSVVSFAQSSQTNQNISLSTEQAHSRAQIVLAQEGFRPGRSLFIGLYFEFEDDWHSYWLNPGDSGAPIALDWKLPADWKLKNRFDPTPKRIETPPLVTFGYENSTLIIAEIEVPQNDIRSQTLIDLDAEWLVCKEVCIPAVHNFRIEIFRDGYEGPKSYQSQIRPELFQQFQQKLPRELSSLKASVEFGSSTYQLTIESDESLKFVDFFPLGKNVLSNEPLKLIEQASQQLVLEGAMSKRAKKPPTYLEGVLLVGLEGEAEPIGVKIKTAEATSEMPSWLTFLFFAFVGGLVLNLMPCVFPVISIKVLSLLKAQERSPSAKPDIGHWPYTFGVLVSFWALAGLLYVLRSGGEALGWGFQLQSPWFVVCLIWIFWLLGFSLFGTFEINILIPPSLSLKRSWPGWLQHFWSGVLSTVVASPCTAPFMGASLGFALSQPFWILMSIFTMLGLGLSAPYLLLGWFPQAARLLPRPGPWMNHLKQLMAFAMWATVIWLLWTLSFQINFTQVASVMVSLLMLSLLLWLKQEGVLKNKRFVQAAIIFGLIGLSLWLAFGGLSSQPSLAGGDANKKAMSSPWQPFSPLRLDELLQAKKAVFIDFTAAWCITCQVNKQTTLEREEVLKHFEAEDIQLLRADWTKRDPEITRMLQSYDRAGVPMYLFFSANGGEPIVLPEILSPALVIKTTRQ